MVNLPSRRRSELTPTGTLVLEEGPANLLFKLVETHEKSTGLGFDLMTMQCDRIDE